MPKEKWQSMRLASECREVGGRGGGEGQMLMLQRRGRTQHPRSGFHTVRLMFSESGRTHPFFLGLDRIQPFLSAELEFEVFRGGTKV